MEQKTNSASTTMPRSPFNRPSRSLLYDPDAGTDVDQNLNDSPVLSMSEELLIIDLVHQQDFPFDLDEEKQSEIPRSESFGSSHHETTFHSYRSATYHFSDKSPSNLSAKSAEIIDRQRCIENPSGAKSANGSPHYSHRSAPSPSVGQKLSAPQNEAGHAGSCHEQKAVTTEEVGVSTNDSGCSRFDDERHCRYCYSQLSKEHNCSACSCNGLLCRDCLQKELLISWNRALNRNQWDPQNRQINQLVPSLKCTVCKFQYPVSRSKLEIETSWKQYIYYLYKKTFPKDAERDRSVFDGFNHGAFNSLYLLPIDTANTVIVFLGLWIGFTMLLEGMGEYQLTDGRVMCFLFDSYLMVELMRITEYLDFPERIWILILYLSRSFLFLGWAIMGKLAEDAQLQLADMSAADEIPEIPDHYNWQWLAILVVFHWVVCGYEMHQYFRAILRRALRDDTGQIRLSITSKSGTEYRFTLPNPEVNPIPRRGGRNNVRVIVRPAPRPNALNHVDLRGARADALPVYGI